MFNFWINARETPKKKKYLVGQLEKFKYGLHIKVTTSKLFGYANDYVGEYANS